MATLRPPLPPPLSHDAISFVSGAPALGGRVDTLSAETVAAIGAALIKLLPPGDITFTLNGSHGTLCTRQLTAWEIIALQEGVQRGSR